MEHLSKEAQKALLLTDKERIKYINSDKWIGYTRCSEILNRMSDLLDYPQSSRMPNLIIIGDTNNGKTAILNRFTNQHKAFRKSPDSELILPVVHIQSPPVPDEKRLYNSILDRLLISYKANERVEKKEMQIVNMLKHLNTRMIIIDEMHNILAGTITKQRAFLNVLKYLSNELKISIVAAGIKEALRAISIDPQLSNRFEPAILPRWKMSQDYLRLLASFEHILPLKKKSNLIDDSTSQTLLLMSEGLIGELSTILKRASVFAIQEKKEKIDKSLLQDLEWKAPEVRRKEIHSV
ncbi:MAG: TniB family NTP-binding protein [Bacteroidetes bacterium]|nr:TniB family NTP-binding protein [Bacteroidota bacterium]